MFLAVFSLTLGSIIPTAIAVNPTDDDAGSGGDAGDRPEAATRIQPGVYEGETSPPMDEYDWYEFHAERGEGLTIQASNLASSQRLSLYDPSGTERVELSRFDSTRTITVHEAGVWQVEIRQSRYSLSPPSEYAFSVRLEPQEAFAVGEELPGGSVVEASVDRPASMNLQAFACARQGPGVGPESAGYQFSVNATVDGQTGTLMLIGFIGSSGTDEAVFVDGPLAGSIELPLEVDLDRFGHCIGVIFSGDVDRALVRGGVFALHADTDSILSFGTNRTAETRSFATDEVVRWDGASNSTRVRGPGVNVADDRSTERALPEGFFGRFSTYGSGGWVETPDGSRIQIDEGEGGIALASQPSGEWRFHVDRSVSVVAADRSYLIGARLPALGLAEPVTVLTEPDPCPSAECRLTIGI
ncbi:hypothetical protein BRD56_00455 [Thermoplasmatales archaeon SW_10_69_26]|nr:MAG: hypothetical protein BRD56_00455 [Thermoplasmatales archaeon SW_10_69_26]